MIQSFVEKLKLSSGAAVMLYRGVSAGGRNFFAYLQCTREGVDKLHRDSLLPPQLPIDIANYGEVLYIDFLSDPDAKAESFLSMFLDYITTNR